MQPNQNYKKEWINYNNSFSGNIDNIPYISVDNFYDKTRRAYFLSHFHGDHTGGLIGLCPITKPTTSKKTSKTRHASKLKKRKAKIYMSEHTAAIFKLAHSTDYSLLSEQIEPLETDKVHELDIDVDKLTVTLVPVDHMPGAVMFLFKVPFKDEIRNVENINKNKTRTILYTGDFVITNDNLKEAYKSLHDEAGRPIQIDEMYCDDTHRSKFAGNVLQELPIRSAVIEKATKLIQNWLAEDENNAVAIKTYYDYGYEDLFAAISEKTGQRIALSDETRLGVYRQIFGVDNKVYTGKPSRIRVYSKNQSTEYEKCCKRPKKFMRIVVKMCNIQESFDPKPEPNGPHPEYTLNYPPHCSRSQLEKFVEHFNKEKQLKVIKYFSKSAMV